MVLRARVSVILTISKAVEASIFIKAVRALVSFSLKIVIFQFQIPPPFDRFSCSFSGMGWCLLGRASGHLAAFRA